MSTPREYTENNKKHLDYLQAIITRMNSNSFMIKGWTVALVSALLALSASSKEPVFLIITLLVTPSFWVLDSIYLLNERKFRDLYKTLIKGGSGIADFDLDINNPLIEKSGTTNFKSVFKSDTMLPFYGFLLGANILVAAYLFFRPAAPVPAPPTINVSIKDTVKMEQIAQPLTPQKAPVDSAKK